MKKIDLGQTINTLANVGVLAGIVFLAIEVSQNQATLEEQNMLTRLSARETASESYGQFRYLLLENPDLLRVWEKAQNDEPLTEFERLQFDQMCVERVFFQLSVYNRFMALGETREAERLAAVLASGIEASDHLGCWNDSRRGEIAARGHDAFVNAVEAARENL